jgi:hypothetical protein
LNQQIKKLVDQIMVEKLEQRIVGRLLKHYPAMRTSNTDIATLLSRVMIDWHDAEEGEKNESEEE